MRAEVIEKGDNSITVKYTAFSPAEAIMLSGACVGPIESGVGVSMSTSGYGKGEATLILSSVSVEVIEMLQPPKDLGK